MKFTVEKSFPKKPDFSINEMFRMAAESAAEEISKTFVMPKWAARYVAKGGSYYYEDDDGTARVTVEIDTDIKG